MSLPQEIRAHGALLWFVPGVTGRRCRSTAAGLRSGLKWPEYDQSGSAMSFPAIRMRRMRRDAFSRALMREHTLLPSDLIMVAFVIEGEGQREAVPSMPGVDRLSIDELVKSAGEWVKLG